MFHVKPGRIALHTILTIDLKHPPQGSGYQGGRNDRSQPRLADKPGRCGPMVTTRPVVSRETLRSSALVFYAGSLQYGPFNASPEQ